MSGPAAIPGVGRILFIRMSAVGDVINTLPALTALRQGFPRAFIGFLVEDRARDLIVNHPYVNRVHLYPRRRWVHMLRTPHRWGALVTEAVRFIHEVRSQHYDVALDMQANLKGAIHAVASSARVRVGFAAGHCKELNHLFSHVRVRPPSDPLNRVDKFLSMVAALGVPTDSAAYRLPDAPASRERVRAFLAELRLRPDGFVVMHPGTSDFGREKRWLPERFSELSARIAKTHGLPSLVTWGPGEGDLAARVAAGSGGAARVALQTQSLLDLAELLRHARLFVGCDSGPLHLSSAVGVPSVALFGPKDPRVYGPHNPRSRVVYGANGNGSPGTMAAITVDKVCQAVGELLQPPA